MAEFDDAEADWFAEIDIEQGINSDVATNDEAIPDAGYLSIQQTFFGDQQQPGVADFSALTGIPIDGEADAMVTSTYSEQHTYHQLAGEAHDGHRRQQWELQHDTGMPRVAEGEYSAEAGQITSSKEPSSDFPLFTQYRETTQATSTRISDTHSQSEQQQQPLSTGGYVHQGFEGSTSDHSHHQMGHQAYFDDDIAPVLAEMQPLLASHTSSSRGREGLAMRAEAVPTTYLDLSGGSDEQLCSPPTTDHYPALHRYDDPQQPAFGESPISVHFSQPQQKSRAPARRQAQCNSVTNDDGVEVITLYTGTEATNTARPRTAAVKRQRRQNHRMPAYQQPPPPSEEEDESPTFSLDAVISRLFFSSTGEAAIRFTPEMNNEFATCVQQYKILESKQAITGLDLTPHLRSLERRIAALVSAAEPASTYEPPPQATPIGVQAGGGVKRNRVKNTQATKKLLPPPELSFAHYTQRPDTSREPPPAPATIEPLQGQTVMVDYGQGPQVMTMIATSSSGIPLEQLLPASRQLNIAPSTAAATVPGKRTKRTASKNIAPSPAPSAQTFFGSAPQSQLPSASIAQPQFILLSGGAQQGEIISGTPLPLFSSIASATEATTVYPSSTKPKPPPRRRNSKTTVLAKGTIPPQMGDVDSAPHFDVIEDSKQVAPSVGELSQSVATRLAERRHLLESKFETIRQSMSRIDYHTPFTDKRDCLHRLLPYAFVAEPDVRDEVLEVFDHELLRHSISMEERWRRCDAKMHQLLCNEAVDGEGRLELNMLLQLDTEWERREAQKRRGVECEPISSRPPTMQATSFPALQVPSFHYHDWDPTQYSIDPPEYEHLMRSCHSPVERKLSSPPPPEIKQVAIKKVSVELTGPTPCPAAEFPKESSPLPYASPYSSEGADLLEDAYGKSPVVEESLQCIETTIYSSTKRNPGPEEVEEELPANRISDKAALDRDNTPALGAPTGYGMEESDEDEGEEAIQDEREPSQQCGQSARALPHEEKQIGSREEKEAEMGRLSKQLSPPPATALPSTSATSTTAITSSGLKLRIRLQQPLACASVGKKEEDSMREEEDCRKEAKSQNGPTGDGKENGNAMVDIPPRQSEQATADQTRNGKLERRRRRMERKLSKLRRKENTREGIPAAALTAPAREEEDKRVESHNPSVRNANPASDPAVSPPIPSSAAALVSLEGSPQPVRAAAPCWSSNHAASGSSKIGARVGTVMPAPMRLENGQKVPSGSECNGAGEGGLKLRLPKLLLARHGSEPNCGSVTIAEKADSKGGDSRVFTEAATIITKRPRGRPPGSGKSKVPALKKGSSRGKQSRLQPVAVRMMAMQRSDVKLRLRSEVPTQIVAEADKASAAPLWTDQARRMRMEEPEPKREADRSRVPKLKIRIGPDPNGPRLAKGEESSCGAEAGVAWAPSPSTPTTWGSSMSPPPQAPNSNKQPQHSPSLMDSEGSNRQLSPLGLAHVNAVQASLKESMMGLLPPSSSSIYIASRHKSGSHFFSGGQYHQATELVAAKTIQFSPCGSDDSDDERLRNETNDLLTKLQ